MHIKTSRKVLFLKKRIHLELNKTEEDEPCLFKLKICGVLVKVDNCMLFRGIAGSIILIMSFAVFWIVWFNS